MIVPILIYHGERDWDKGDRLANILEKPLPGFEKFVPDYNFLLYDFSDLTEGDIKGNIKLKILSYLFSKIFSRDLQKALENVIPLLLELHYQNTARDYILTVLNYITNVFGEIKTIEDLKKEVEKVSREGREMVMTFTQEILEEGKKEGKIENMQEMLEFSLEVKFGVISKSLSDKIKKIDSYDRLQKMKDAIKTSDNLEEFKEKVVLQ
ncbi:MAG: Rpn family recombination-promoting nuclease/putative transposase [Halanaerobiales bacterium]|nr:Rpn family recombination-promoting nuclease/putative transposase [Halanaerobiales bacterium]